MYNRCLKRGETSGRSDDNPRCLKTRVKNYFEQSVSVVDYFDEKGLVDHIDASTCIDEQAKQIQKIVAEK